MKDKHIIQLDGLRFFAVLMVMVGHWFQWRWTDPILTKLPLVHGVTLFFVLSGFLITRILISNRDKYDSAGQTKLPLIKNFYVRRFFRIFPIYYLLIFALFIFDFRNTREMFPWLVSYTSNIYQSITNNGIPNFNHFWSLAVEEQFYLFWPFIIVFLRPKRTLPVILLTIAIAMLTRTYLALYTGKWMAIMYFTVCNMHALGIGALLAYLKTYRTDVAERLSRPTFVYGAIGTYLLLLFCQKYFEWEWYSKIFETFSFAIASFFIILRASENGFKGLGRMILENRFVTYSGKISYGLYVYHLFVPDIYYFLAPKLGLNISNNYLLFLAFYAIAFVISHFSWVLIEAPINRLKDRFPYLGLNKQLSK